MSVSSFSLHCHCRPCYYFQSSSKPFVFSRRRNRNRSMTTWVIRGRYDTIIPEQEYVNEPTVFSLKIHHDGFFRKNPVTKYVNGTEHYVDYIDIDMFSVLEFLNMLSELGLDDDDGLPMFYHFQIPELDLDNGLHSLASDVDVNVLAKFVSAHKIINVYIEHGKTNVKSYFKSPQSSKVRIEQLPDEPQPIRPKKKTPKKRLLLEWVPIDEPNVVDVATDVANEPNVVEQPKVIDVATEVANEPNVVEQSKVIDVATEVANEPNLVEQSKVIDVATEVANEPNVLEQSKVIDVANEPNIVEQPKHIGEGSGNIWSSYMDDQFFTDYIFLDKNDQGQGQTDVNDQGQGKSVVDDQGGNSVEGERSHSAEGENDSSDSEFVPDEANMGDEVEVDMSDFTLNVDKDAEWMSISELERNTENIDIEDMDIDDFFSESEDELERGRKKN